MKRIRAIAVGAALLLGLGLAVPAAAATPAAGPATQFVDQGIRASMIGGNSIDERIREAKPRADGYRHIDTPRLIRQLKKLNVNTYVFQIWNSPTDWGDLVDEFAPAAQKAGIQVWPYIVPPSECDYYNSDHTIKPRYQRGRCSQPFREDYVAWAEAIADLSLRYPVITNWSIDDFQSGNNAATFTTQYMTEIKQAQDSINPNLGLYTTAYYHTAISDAFYDKYAPFIKGIVYPYSRTDGNPLDLVSVQPDLDNILSHTEPRHLKVMFLSYTGRPVAHLYDANADYLTALFDRVRPYVADGRLQGIISYATPMGAQPAVSSQDKAKTGVGRLSLALPYGNAGSAGDWASASQQVAVQPGRSSYSVTFSDSDQWARIPAGDFGYFSKQLLVDGQLVWQSDIMDGNQDEYAQQTVDVTPYVAGKRTVTLTFKLVENKAVGNFPVDAGFDDVSGSGLVIHNGGFESRAGWAMADNGANVLPYIDIWTADLPAEQFQAVAREFSIMGGQHPTKVKVRQSGPPANPRAMYGPGRLSLSLGNHEASTAGQCASASQVVAVTPGLPRYELSFWQFDQWGKTLGGTHHKQVLIDGFPIYDVDTVDNPANDWIQGQELIGGIDVTDQVQGKVSVTLSFRLCEVKGTTDFPVDVGFDNIQTVGLNVVNPGFDTKTGWTLTSDGNLKAALDVA